MYHVDWTWVGLGNLKTRRVIYSLKNLYSYSISL